MNPSEKLDSKMTSRSRRLASPFTAFVLALSVAALPSACKDANPEPDDDDNVVNPGGDGNDDDSNGSGGKGSQPSGGKGNPGTGGKGGGTGGKGSGSGGQGGENPGGEGNTPSGGSDPGGIGGGFVEPPREDCPEEPNGEECWDLTKCNGVTTTQFLEQCGGTCQAPFNNEERIEGFTGSLPSLP